METEYSDRPTQVGAPERTSINSKITVGAYFLSSGRTSYEESWRGPDFPIDAQVSHLIRSCILRVNLIFFFHFSSFFFCLFQ